MPMGLKSLKMMIKNEISMVWPTYSLYTHFLTHFFEVGHTHFGLLVMGAWGSLQELDCKHEYCAKVQYVVDTGLLHCASMSTVQIAQYSCLQSSSCNEPQAPMLLVLASLHSLPSSQQHRVDSLIQVAFAMTLWGQSGKTLQDKTELIFKNGQK